MDDLLTVNGKRCVVRVLDGAALANFEHLEQLVQMQNRAFARGSRQPVLPADTTRFYSVAQYVGQTGAAATTFVLMAAGEGSEIFGSVTIAPYAPPPADLRLPTLPAAFTRAPLGDADGEEAEARWEVRCLAVSPGAQKQGLAGRLLALAEAHAARVAQGERTVRLMLSCIRENNGAFYARRGFVEAEGEERRMPPGFIGSEGGFSIVFMDKYVEAQASG